MPGEWRRRIVATIAAGSRRPFPTRASSRRHPSCIARLCQLRSGAFSTSAMNCMSRRITPAIVALSAAISVSLCCWSLDQPHAQQPRPAAQKGPAGSKAGANAAGGNAQAGDAEGGGRSPAQPHIARARQLINQAQDFDGAMKELDAALQLDPKNPLVYMWRGIDLNRMSRYGDAIGEFSQAL